MNSCDIYCIDNTIFLKIHTDIDSYDLNLIVQKIKCISNLYKILDINLELEDNFNTDTIEQLKEYLFKSNPYYKIKTYNYIVE